MHLNLWMLLLEKYTHYASWAGGTFFQLCCCVSFCCGGKANLEQIFLLNPRIFFSYIGIVIQRGWTTDRKLHVDTLLFIPTWKFNVFHIPDIFLVNTLLLHSLSPYGRTEIRTEKRIHSLHVGWRNFFSAVLEKFLLPLNALNVYGT
jgi:hypothetical protein